MQSVQCPSTSTPVYRSNPIQSNPNPKHTHPHPMSSNTAPPPPPPPLSDNDVDFNYYLSANSHDDGDGNPVILQSTNPSSAPKIDSHSSQKTKKTANANTNININAETNGNLELEELPPGVSRNELYEDALIRMLMANTGSGNVLRWNDGVPATGNVEDDLELTRRMRDFKFAQQKRRHKYGVRKPLGIYGLYDHLAGIRTDVEWAEDAAWRRHHGEPYLSWSDFDGCKNAGLNKPFFVYFTISICTVMLVISIFMNGGFEESSVNPMIGPSSETLINLGAKKTDLIIDEGEYYRLFAPMILHAGIIHYIVNMFVLWFIGRAIELSHGTLATAIIFILPGLGGNILSAIFLSEYISVGASGGIFALIGACLADIARHWSLLFNSEVTADIQKKNYRKVLGWLLFDVFINVIIGLTPMVDNFTHMGGLVYGFLCGYSTMERLRPAFFGIEKTKYQRLFASIIERLGIIIVVVMIFVTLVILLIEDGEEACEWCKYISCAPMPFWTEDKWWHCDDCGGVQGRAVMKNDIFINVSFTCPDGEQIIEKYDISEAGITNNDELSGKLPGYCRDLCDNVSK